MGRIILSVLKYTWRFIVLAVLLIAFIGIVSFSKNAAKAIDPETGAISATNAQAATVVNVQSKINAYVETIKNQVKSVGTAE